jgi:o-succinylbenzoate synthase
VSDDRERTDHRGVIIRELREIELPLVAPFRTSFGTQTTRRVLLVRAETEADGAIVEGWGECVATEEPTYSSEYVDGARLAISGQLVPRLHSAGPVAADAVATTLAAVKGHEMAKAALEMAVLDAELRAAGQSFADQLGATRTRVPSGVSVGIHESVTELLDAVESYVADGYVRIKLKIEPGWDLEPVAAVRKLIGPDTPLQVDANTAYRRDDIDHLCRLDEFDLLLIEQPLPEDDLVGHVRLARAAQTPVCLDESITSVTTAVDAIELGACAVVNIKPGRVGGYLAARRIHDACADLGVPVWCGGMLETGIGRAANAALAALAGFTLPGDISAARRFWARDIVRDPIDVVDGHVAVPTGPGFGYELDREFLDSVTTAVTSLSGTVPDARTR